MGVSVNGVWAPPFQVIQGADCHAKNPASRRKRSSALVSTVSLARDTPIAIQRGVTMTGISLKPLSCPPKINSGVSYSIFTLAFKS